MNVMSDRQKECHVITQINTSPNSTRSSLCDWCSDTSSCYSTITQIYYEPRASARRPQSNYHFALAAAPIAQLRDVYRMLQMRARLQKVIRSCFFVRQTFFNSGEIRRGILYLRISWYLPTLFALLVKAPLHASETFIHGILCATDIRLNQSRRLKCQIPRHKICSLNRFESIKYPIAIRSDDGRHCESQAIKTIKTMKPLLIENSFLRIARQIRLTTSENCR